MKIKPVASIKATLLKVSETNFMTFVIVLVSLATIAASFTVSTRTHAALQ